MSGKLDLKPKESTSYETSDKIMFKITVTCITHRRASSHEL